MHPTGGRAAALKVVVQCVGAQAVSAQSVVVPRDCGQYFESRFAGVLPVHSQQGAAQRAATREEGALWRDDPQNDWQHEVHGTSGHFDGSRRIEDPLNAARSASPWNGCGSGGAALGMAR